MNMLEIIKEQYPKLGYKKTANLIGISLYDLKKIIKKNDMVLGDRIRNVELSNFTNITSKEVSYFLGFFWSDGYISNDEVVLMIKSTDGLEILEILNKFGKWNYSERIRKLNNKEYKQSCIKINDKYIKKFLVDNDYLYKSLKSPSKILSSIDDDLKPYFFRGLIDGDGCFCSKNRNYFSITGHINQDWFEVDNLLNKLDIKYKLTRKERTTGNSSYIVSSSRKDIIKLGNFIYGEYFDGIGLKRKYDIYFQIKNK